MLSNPLKRPQRLSALLGLMLTGTLLADDRSLSHAKPADVGMSAQKLAEVSAALQRWVGEKRLPGGIVLAARDGKVVFHHAVGHADVEAGRRMTPETPVMVASMTKPITATAVMMLAEQGKLSIDDPVHTYLPAFKDQKVYGGGTATITIQQLLCHTSGMDQWDESGNRPVEPAAGQTVLTAFVDGLAKRPLQAKPGEHFTYSSNGYAVLGRVIEVVSGQTCEQFITERVLKPLGMTHSTFRMTAELVEKLPTIYARRELGPSWRPDGHMIAWKKRLVGKLAPIYPAGGLISTAGDMARFCQMVLNRGALDGTRLLKPATVERMCRNHTPGAASGWGLGWSKYYKEHCPIGSSPRHVNHAGLFGTYMFVEPAFDLVVVFLQQLDLRGHLAEESFKLVRSAVKVDPDQAPDYGLPLVARFDFEDGKAERWQPTDPKAWRIKTVDGRKVYNQYAQSKYKPKYRSPFNISWLTGLELGDFVIEYRLRSTTKTYGHRDMCLFFGKQDAQNFYYVHMGFKGDANSNSIMIVDDKPRVSIIQDKLADKDNDYTFTESITHQRVGGTKWTDEWHRVRLIRRADAGTIEVYFNDVATPHMYAIDKTFGAGQIGIGSFDDTGYWDEITVWGDVASGQGNVDAGTGRGERLFNGKDLTGWTVHGNEKWYVHDGLLVCESGPEKKYGYLSYKDSPQDFDLSLRFKLIGSGNSGVFFRSVLDGVKITGWQAEVAPKNTGGVYESGGRGWLHKPGPAAEPAYRHEAWNDYRVRVVDDHVQVWINGVKAVDFRDAKVGKGQPDGKIALQIHSGGGVKVLWKDLLLKRLE